jgi:putative transposase
LALAGHAYHVLNRGVRRTCLFKDQCDYLRFLWLMSRAAQRVPMRLLAYVLMPNHWHLVLWPERDDAVSAYVKWLAGTHACHFNRRYGHSGAVYQGRFRSVAIYDSLQLLRVLRYVEANPVRAGLAARAEEWRWSSVSRRACDVVLTPSPIPRPAAWLELLADPEVDLISAVLTPPASPAVRRQPAVSRVAYR